MLFLFMRNKKLFMYIGLFLCFYLLSYLLPFTADDFTWSKNTIEFYFKTGHFLDYDGRYADI